MVSCTVTKSQSHGKLGCSRAARVGTEQRRSRQPRQLLLRPRRQRKCRSNVSRSSHNKLELIFSRPGNGKLLRSESACRSGARRALKGLSARWQCASYGRSVLLSIRYCSSTEAARIALAQQVAKDKAEAESKALVDKEEYEVAQARLAAFQQRHREETRRGVLQDAWRCYSRRRVVRGCSAAS